MVELSLVVSSLRISVPYAAGALGGTLTERSGTVNIAIEGFMLTGAFAFACVAYYCQSSWMPEITAEHPWIPLVLGLLAAVVAAMGISLFHAVTTLIFRADHIVSGLAVNFLALGLTDFLLQKLFGSASNSPPVPGFPLLPGNETPALQDVGGLMHPIILLLLLVIVSAYVLLKYTSIGLRMRAAGENPLAASAAGLKPAHYRLYGILMGAGCSALGGVWLVSEQGLFSSNMTAGRGYIALAAMILGRWKVWGVTIVCIFFGFAEALQNFMQVARQTGGDEAAWTDQLTILQQWVSAVPIQLIQALPYILTLIVVAGFVGRSNAPASVGKPLEEE